MRIKVYPGSLEQFLLVLIGSVSIWFIIRGNYGQANTNGLIFGLIWIGLAFLLGLPISINTIKTKAFVCLLWILIYILIAAGFSYDGGIAVNTALSFIVKYGSIILLPIYLRKIDTRLLRLLIVIVITFFLFINVRFIILSYSVPSFGRLSIAHLLDSSIDSTIPCPYAICQASTIISTALFHLLTKGHIDKIRNKIIVLFVIVVFTIGTIKVQSTLTVITMFALYAISIYVNIILKKSTHKIIYVFFWPVIIALTLLLFRNQLGQIVLDLTSSNSGVMTERISQIGSYFSGSSSGYNDLLARSSMYVVSLQGFVEHPLLGTVYTVKQVFGNHNEILNVFSDYGIIGGVPMILIIIYFLRITKRRLVTNIDYMVWLPVLLLSLTNSLYLNQVFYSFMFIVPVIYYLSFNNTCTDSRTVS